jgi:cell division protein FtsQ
VSDAAGSSPSSAAPASTVRPPPNSRRDRKPPSAVAAPRPVSRVWRATQLVAGVIVVLAASILVGWGARKYVLSSPRFAIRTVVVEGVHKRTAEQVAVLGGIRVGNNVFALDVEMTRAAIAADPWIERATVARQLPGTIHVTIIEREARALVAIGGELYLATRDGELFKRVGEGDPVDLPVVTGVLPDQVASDRPGVVLTVKRLLDASDDMERFGMTKVMPLQELHLERDGALVATLGKDAVMVHLGHAPYRAKIDQGARVLSELSRRRAVVSVIFLDNDAHPERVVVRTR